MGRIKVMLNQQPMQCRLTKGDIGFIDGYVRGGDYRAYAVVASGDIIEMIPLHCLTIVRK